MTVGAVEVPPTVMVESPAVTDVTLAARSVVKLVTCDSVIARLGRLVVVEVARVADEGIVVPLIDVAVATPNDGVVKLGLTNGALAARSVVRFVTCDSVMVSKDWLMPMLADVEVPELVMGEVTETTPDEPSTPATIISHCPVLELY